MALRSHASVAVCDDDQRTRSERLSSVPHQRGPTDAPEALPAPPERTLVAMVRSMLGFPRSKAGTAPPLEPARTEHGAVAAFFDVDNTLVHGATLFHLARALCAEGFFRWSDLLRFARHQVRYMTLGEGNLDKAREEALDLLAGHDVDTLVSVAERVYREVLAQRLHHETVELVDAHRAAGHQVWLVTASPVELAQVLADHLGATGCVATVAERADGQYTGRLIGEPVHGPAKGRAIRALAQRAGLDLSASYAYGDSHNDLSALTSVGHPVAVNPDPRLRRSAARRGWPRYEFRTGRQVTVRGAGLALVLSGLWWAYRRTHR
jgi:HAD superfamily hydrolase (TIGR01490 family)